MDQSATTQAYVSGWKEASSLYGNELMIQSLIRPSISLPACEVIWGLLTLTMLEQSMHSGFFSGYLNRYVAVLTWDTPAELGKRLAIFGVSGISGSMFLGILQAALYKNLNGAGGLEVSITVSTLYTMLTSKGWQWLFIFLVSHLRLAKINPYSTYTVSLIPLDGYAISIPAPLSDAGDDGQVQNADISISGKGAASVSRLLEESDVVIDVSKDVADQLREEGASLESIDAIIWSHHQSEIHLNKTTFPGFPSNLDAETLDEAFQGRECTAREHMCALAHTSENEFIFLGGDVAHHAGEFRPTIHVPLPDEIHPSPLDSDAFDPQLPPLSACPGSVIKKPHPRKETNSGDYRTTPFYEARWRFLKDFLNGVE
ncbi:uncharacterized protein BDW70DRAFT_148098 [Aspergillus foveolatus]|uniref:uncharacterized protein n=1 Tax=Aspergillus foveolatus TaxID=210207 RepID=UPI003CCCE05D